MAKEGRRLAAINAVTEARDGCSGDTRARQQPGAHGVSVHRRRGCIAARLRRLLGRPHGNRGRASGSLQMEGHATTEIVSYRCPRRGPIRRQRSSNSKANGNPNGFLERRNAKRLGACSRARSRRLRCRVCQKGDGLEPLPHQSFRCCCARWRACRAPRCAADLAKHAPAVLAQDRRSLPRPSTMAFRTIDVPSQPTPSCRRSDVARRC